MHKPVIIVKLGTSSIIKADGSVNRWLIGEVARQFSELSASYRLLLVSSGAVGLGRSALSGFHGKMSERKAAAAVGNPILISEYAAEFSRYGLNIAQSLCERGHFSNRNTFLQLRDTIETLWQNNIIPVANENDVVSDLELKFSDNDELATLMAVGFGAEHLLIGTSVPGVLDRNGELVPQISDFNEEVMLLANREKSAFGLGGMVSKLTFARLATRLGIRVVIFGSNVSDGIMKALNGETGTTCLPRGSSADARRKWLASGSLVSGRIRIDSGAGAALKVRKSLLSVGVTEIVSGFEKGEVVEIVIGDDIWPIGVARVKVSSAELKNKLGHANLEVAHADDIVIL